MKATRFFVQTVATFVMAVCFGFGALGQEKGVMDRYLDKYWGEKREIKVIQKRLFQKDGRHEVGLFGGTIPNDEFLLYYPVGLRYNFYFSEDIGVELFGSYMFSQHTRLAAFLEDPENFNVKIDTYLPQKLLWTAGLEGLYSPIHGKVGIFTMKLFHFDIHLALGVSFLVTDVGTREEGGERKTKYDIAGNVGTGIRMYLTNNVAARVEYRNFFYASEQGGVSHPAEITLGASYFF